MGIWIDRVYRGAFRELAACAALYRAVFVVVAVVSINAGVSSLVYSLSVWYKAIIPWHFTVSDANLS